MIPEDGNNYLLNKATGGGTCSSCFYKRLADAVILCTTILMRFTQYHALKANIVAISSMSSDSLNSALPAYNNTPYNISHL